MINSKKTEQEQENKSSLDDSDFPPLTKSSTKSTTTTSTTTTTTTSTTMANTILNFLQAAKKTPAPETDPEEESLINDDADVEKPQFKKGFSFD
jgi:hypothetical protein